MKKLFTTVIAAAALTAGAAETFRLDVDDTIIDRKSMPILLKGRAVRKVGADGKGAIQLRTNKFVPFQLPNDGRIINPAGGKISFRFKPYFTVKAPGDAAVGGGVPPCFAERSADSGQSSGAQVLYFHRLF